MSQGQGRHVIKCKFLVNWSTSTWEWMLPERSRRFIYLTPGQSAKAIIVACPENLFKSAEHHHSVDQVPWGNYATILFFVQTVVVFDSMKRRRTTWWMDPNYLFNWSRAKVGDEISFSFDPLCIKTTRQRTVSIYGEGGPQEYLNSVSQSVRRRISNQNKTKIQWPGNKSWDDANKKFKSIVCSLAPGFYFHPSHHSVLQVQVLSSSDQLVQLMWRHACNALPLVQVQCRALCETSWIRSSRRRVES